MPSLGGLYDIDFITQGYDALRDVYGVNVIHDSATTIDPSAKKVVLAGGTALQYDHLVMSPGIDFQWGAIEGYDETSQRNNPTCLEGRPADPDFCAGNSSKCGMAAVVIIAPPKNPFRCPPGPMKGRA